MTDVWQYRPDQYNNKRGSVGRWPPSRWVRNYPPPDAVAPTYFIATWKNLEFYVDTTSDELGRRGDVYEFPLSETVGYKDMGRRAVRYKVEGYLIGTEQLRMTKDFANAAQNAEPGMFTHPIYGPLQVACTTCTLTADYRKDKKRTRIALEFVEANPSMAPYYAWAVGSTLGNQYPESLFQDGNAAVQQSMTLAEQLAQGLPKQGTTPQTVPEAYPWPGPQLARATAGNGNSAAAPPSSPTLADDISQALADLVAPAIDEKSHDAIAMLGRAGGTFRSVAAPIDYASATIRRIHTDALERLREFNGYVVSRAQWPMSDSVHALIQTTRLIMIRDYAVAVAQKAYDTVKAAIDDLDFIVAVYDEEEAVATQRCDDALVAAIYKARATAIQIILGKNIRLPGIVEFSVDGVWPSLLVAHKIYADGRRYQQVEDYNPTMSAFYMGRSVIAPAR